MATASARIFQLVFTRARGLDFRSDILLAATTHRLSHTTTGRYRFGTATAHRFRHATTGRRRRGGQMGMRRMVRGGGGGGVVGRMMRTMDFRGDHVMFTATANGFIDTAANLLFSLVFGSHKLLLGTSTRGLFLTTTTFL